MLSMSRQMFFLKTRWTSRWAYPHGFGRSEAYARSFNGLLAEDLTHREFYNLIGNGMHVAGLVSFWAYAISICICRSDSERLEFPIVRPDPEGIDEVGVKRARVEEQGKAGGSDEE